MDLLKIETFPLGKLQCNCSLIYNEQTRESIIIDPGDDAEALLNLIEERNLKVKMLLHTHAHFDHIRCSKEIKSKTLAKYLIQGLGSRLRSRLRFLSRVLEISGGLFLYFKCIINKGITIIPIINKSGIN